MAEGFEREQPGSAAEQVDAEIAVAQVGQIIVGTFGGEYQHQSGGGGAGGHYEFTSLAELDGIIADLKFELDGIFSDGNKIRQAIGLVEPPARDIMSQLQAQATINSWQLALDHNQRMWHAANAEIDKLEAARKAYSHTEDVNTAKMKNQG
ncbi:hypothetical protein LWC34_02140 [Kibdelosporangium philippinense]|uniref:PE domain-containing protein n=1 Tax=Kibdelosporangium philippinense TaxID=211113 RepID=A0ABS8Z4T5_9PSEU|nr:hypothetical protein [Kibdelosporangium philippinense]MCE7001646.1 hypothetical protein [Kibdelosporangium philippinense]